MKEKIKKIVTDLLFIIIGCALNAYATIGILLPNGLSTGGLTGTVRLVQTITHFNFSVLYYIFAFIILVACKILLGTKEARKIIMMAILYPAFLVLFEKLNISLLEQKDTILAAIYYGVFSGFGCGFIFQRGFSFGGTDTIAKIFHKKVMPFISISQILLVIDAVIIIWSGFLYGRPVAMYALISQVIFVKCIDFIMFGFDSKLVKIDVISDQYKEIEDYVMNELGRGISRVEIVGAYSGERKTQITSICSPRESMLIKNFIARVDKNAFVNVIHVESVWGKGTGFENLAEEKA